LFVLNSGIGIDTPTTAWLFGTPPVVTRFTPALTVTSGMRRARSSDMAAFERSISARATRAAAHRRVARSARTTARPAARFQVAEHRKPVVARLAHHRVQFLARDLDTAARGRLRSARRPPRPAPWSPRPATPCRPARDAPRSAERAAIAADSSVT
jgi:hypothetical protein